MTLQTTPTSTDKATRWQPVAATERRVLGVLVEKAKTTADAYPMSINALVTGANQRNNRDPLMQVDADQVEEALEQLRAVGAVGEVQGGGRVARFRHYLYDWLGVDKVELAVMAELLLRGEQTEGDLRGRAARMEPIADVAALRPVLDGLRAKGLVVSLSPEGRGHIVTHALYLPQEMERLRTRHGHGDQPVHERATCDEPAHAADREPAHAAAAAPEQSEFHTAPQRPTVQPQAAEPAATASQVAELRREISGLRDEVETLREQLDDLRAALDRLRQDVGG